MIAVNDSVIDHQKMLGNTKLLSETNINDWKKQLLPQLSALAW
jgi:hypothetical protein